MFQAHLVVSQALKVKVSPEWRLNPGFGTQKKFPQMDDVNRGNRYKDYINIFPDQMLCPLRCPTFNQVLKKI